VPEISAQAGMAERSAYRLLARVQAKLQRLRTVDEED
jgi:hypothetical protein